MIAWLVEVNWADTIPMGGKVVKMWEELPIISQIHIICSSFLILHVQGPHSAILSALEHRIKKVMQQHQTITEMKNITTEMK